MCVDECTQWLVNMAASDQCEWFVFSFNAFTMQRDWMSANGEIFNVSKWGEIVKLLFCYWTRSVFSIIILGEEGKRRIRCSFTQMDLEKRVHPASDWFAFSCHCHSLSSVYNFQTNPLSNWKIEHFRTINACSCFVALTPTTDTHSKIHSLHS